MPCWSHAMAKTLDAVNTEEEQQRSVDSAIAMDGYLRDIYQMPDVKKTCRLDHIKTHYYWSQTTVNPHRVVPLGPTIDLEGKHDRLRFG